jgi:hypothetical protein
MSSLNFDYAQVIDSWWVAGEFMVLLSSFALLHFVVPSTKGRLPIWKFVRGLIFALVPAIALLLLLLFFNPRNSVQIFLLLSVFTLDALVMCGIPATALLLFILRVRMLVTIAAVYLLAVAYCVIRAYSVGVLDGIGLGSLYRFAGAAFGVEVLLFAFWAGAGMLVAGRGDSDLAIARR